MNSFAQPWEEVSLLGHCIYAKIENCTAAMQILVKWCKKQILESINTRGYFLAVKLNVMRLLPFN